MQMLSEDDLDLKTMTVEQVEAAWDFWFDLAQETDPFDPPYTHGVFVSIDPSPAPLFRGGSTCDPASRAE